MVNPCAGEVEIRLNGQAHVAKLTLGSLAELESAMPDGSFVDLVERFEGGSFSPRDVLAIILAGLRGAGWTGSEAELVKTQIGDGPMEAARLAGQLLVRAFSPQNALGGASDED